MNWLRTIGLAGMLSAAGIGYVLVSGGGNGDAGVNAGVADAGAAPVRHVAVPWGDAGMPPLEQLRCREADVAITPSARAALGLVEDEQLSYGRYRGVGIVGADGDVQWPEMLPGMSLLLSTVEAVACAPGMVPHEVWLSRDPGAVHRCACGAGCEYRTPVFGGGLSDWRRGAARQIYQAGRWRVADAGCEIVACAALAGQPGPCDGR